MKVWITVPLEIGLEFEGDYSPYVEGRIFGPPENCFPDEPAEFEATEVNILIPLKDGKVKRLKCPIEISDMIDEEDLLWRANEQYSDDCMRLEDNYIESQRRD
jgi:hypothetical protein